MQEYQGFPGWQNVAKLNRKGVGAFLGPFFNAAGINIPADLKTGVKKARNPIQGEGILKKPVSRRFFHFMERW
jgi:hypothetical protein